jgi:ribosomal protein S18 acetylase RimI-like enzyme
VQRVYRTYHQPDYFCPDPYVDYPSHAHIDLLPRAQGRGHGRHMMEQLLAALRRHGSPGVHLGVSVANTRAQGFYTHLGFRELTRAGSGDDACVYMGIRL